MSQATADTAEQRDLRQLLQILDKIEPWIAAVSSNDRPTGIWTPQPRSPLSTDDARTHPYQVSHRAWAALTAAVDFLHCFKRSLLQSVTEDTVNVRLHSYAQTSLLRGAIENAAVAVCLLARSRAERITTRLQLEWKELKSVYALRKLAGVEPEFTIDERRIRLERLLLGAGLPATIALEASDEMKLRAARAALRDCDYVMLVRRAGELTNGAGAVLCEACWRMCSGLAHGDMAATLGLLPGVFNEDVAVVRGEDGRAEKRPASGCWAGRWSSR
ncbi:hypothetical protein ACQEVZ_54885 [Dactylosporangium sp. CA-152071]|uniref:hypothetical protein n=1 Tax=Dactylosporangium sp. CA-152071 TaxID=3239933 RepID=UPI003D8D7967